MKILVEIVLEFLKGRKITTRNNEVVDIDDDMKVDGATNIGEVRVVYLTLATE